MAIIPISKPREHIGTLSYLASPFSHTEVRTRRARAYDAGAAAAFLMNRFHAVYSPIVHGYSLSEKFTLPEDWEFWRVQCVSMLSRCDQLYVLRLEGWEESIGVQEEIKVADALQIPILHMTPLPGGGYRIGGGA